MNNLFFVFTPINNIRTEKVSIGFNPVLKHVLMCFNVPLALRSIFNG